VETGTVAVLFNYLPC